MQNIKNISHGNEEVILNIIEELKNNPSNSSNDFIKILSHKVVRKMYMDSKSISIIYNFIDSLDINDEYLNENKIDNIINDLSNHLFEVETPISIGIGNIDFEILSSIKRNEILRPEEKFIFSKDELKSILASILMDTRSESVEEIKKELENRYKSNSERIKEYLSYDESIIKQQNKTRKKVEESI